MSELTESQEKPRVAPMELAVLVAGRVKIHGVMLSTSRTNRPPDPDEDLSSIALKVSIPTPHAVFNRSLQEDRFFVQMVFALSITQSDHPDGREIAAVEATYSLVYSAENLAEFTDDHLQAFANINGIFNAWPYWREFVQSTTSRMGLPAITIPVFRAYNA